MISKDVAFNSWLPGILKRITQGSLFLRRRKTRRPCLRLSDVCDQGLGISTASISLRVRFHDGSLDTSISDSATRLRCKSTKFHGSGVNAVGSYTPLFFSPSVSHPRRTMWKWWQFYCALLHVSVFANRKSALDTPFNIMLLRAFREWTFDALGTYRNQQYEYKYEFIIFLAGLFFSHDYHYFSIVLLKSAASRLFFRRKMKITGSARLT